MAYNVQKQMILKGAIHMDNKQIPDNKIAAEEILKDSELDSVAGGGHAGGTGVGCVPVFKSPLDLSNLTNELRIAGQLGTG